MTKRRILLGLLPLALIGLAAIWVAGSILSRPVLGAVPPPPPPARSIRLVAVLGEDGPLPVQAMVLQAVYPDLRSAIFNRLAQRIGRPLAYLGEPMLSYQSWMRLGVSPARLAPARAISHFRGPVLVVGGTADCSTPVSETRALYAAAAGPKALWLLPGFGHAVVGTLWTDLYRERVRTLFLRTLGDPRMGPPAPPAPMARGR